MLNTESKIIVFFVTKCVSLTNTMAQLNAQAITPMATN